MAKLDLNRLWSRLWAKKARPFTIVAFLFLVFLTWQIMARLPRGGPPGGPRGAAVAVEIAAVERGGIRDIGTFSGTLIPKSYITIVPKISGRIKMPPRLEGRWSLPGATPADLLRPIRRSFP